MFLLTGLIVFTPQGCGIIKESRNQNGEISYAIQLPIEISKEIAWFTADEVHTAEQECTVRSKMAHLDVMRELSNVESARELGVYPDMSKVSMPVDPAGFEQLGRSLRRFFSQEVYRPKDLGDLDAWFRVNREAIRMRLAWGPQFHRAMHLKADELGTKIPNDAVPLAIGSQGGTSIERGPKGYVWFPKPPDSVTIYPEFRAKETQACRPGELEIANVRLVMGMMVMGFPLTTYTKIKKPSEIVTDTARIDFACE